MTLQEWLESVASPAAVITIVRPARGTWVVRLWEPLGDRYDVTGGSIIDAMNALKEALGDARDPRTKH